MTSPLKVDGRNYSCHSVAVCYLHSEAYHSGSLLESQATFLAVTSATCISGSFIHQFIYFKCIHCLAFQHSRHYIWKGTLHKVITINHCATCSWTLRNGAHMLASKFRTISPCLRNTFPLKTLTLRAFLQSLVAHSKPESLCRERNVVRIPS